MSTLTTNFSLHKIDHDPEGTDDTVTNVYTNLNSDMDTMCSHVKCTMTSNQICVEFHYDIFILTYISLLLAFSFSHLQSFPQIQFHSSK